MYGRTGTLSCTITGCIGHIGIGTGVLSLAALSVERYFAIVKHKDVKMKTAVIASVSCWFYASFNMILAFIPSLPGIETSPTQVYCTIRTDRPKNIIYGIIAVITIACCNIALVASYYLIVRALKQSETALQKLGITTLDKLRFSMSTVNKQHIKEAGLQETEIEKISEEAIIVFKCSVIVTVFVICTIPYLGLCIYHLIVQSPNETMEFISYAFLKVNTVLNPLLAIFLDKNWSKVAKDFISGLVSPCTGQKKQPPISP